MIINQQNNKSIKIGDIYKCYSPVLHNHFKREGFLCLDDGFNNETKKPYWLYRMTNALSRELTLWTNNKNKQIK